MEGQVRVGPRPFLCRGRVAGVRGARSPPWGCGGNSFGLCSCSTAWAAKASPYSLAVRCMRRAGQRLSRRRARPPVLVECVARSRFVRLYEGGPLGQGRLARGCRG